MWEFRQRNGKDGDIVRDGVVIGHAYSGYDDGDGIREEGEGKNDPSKQGVRNVGPIPYGRYRIGRPFFHGSKGPYVMRLTPEPGTNTFGRSGFLIHGDSVKRPGSASHGCIIANRALRIVIGEAVTDDGDDLMDIRSADEVDMA